MSENQHSVSELGHKIRVLREQEDRIYVFKPSGVLSVAPTSGFEVPHLRSELLKMGLIGSVTECIPVHRLDFETSGVLVFAKNANTHRKLSGFFEKRKVKKTYHAWVYGKPSMPAFESTDPVSEKPSHTKFTVLEKHKETSLLEARPLTGRRHQIRKHLIGLGLPILGDPVYAPHSVEGFRFYIDEIKKKDRDWGKFPMGLHAYSIQLPDDVEVVAPKPASWAEFLHWSGTR